jgi:DNA-directed RNA polymerase subunit RPC12/RpoP
MLGSTVPPIKYSCPRCQTPLEAPATEAGTKKPCPSCGQRLQVPAPPPPAAAAPAPGLNKTMLAGDESAPPAPPIKYNCPRCKKPLESPASEAGLKKPCPACGQRHQVPAAPPAPGQPNLNKTMLASDTAGPAPSGGQPGYAAATAPGAPAAAPAGQLTIGGYTISARTLALAAAALVLLIIVVPAVVRGGKTEDLAAAAAQRKELERATADVEQKKAELERLTRFETETREKINALAAKQAAAEQRLHEELRDDLRRISDEKQRAEAEDRFREKERQMEQERLKSEEEQKKILAEAKAAIEAKAKELDAAKQAQQTIIQQPPSVYYYPPYHWRYYYWW